MFSAITFWQGRFCLTVMGLRLNVLAKPAPTKTLPFILITRYDDHTINLKISLYAT
jgi:hypothetical protein